MVVYEIFYDVILFIVEVEYVNQIRTKLRKIIRCFLILVSIIKFNPRA